MKSPRPVPSLAADLLEEIFLRIGSPADLARASAACVAFRRLIADPSFLRRYRSLHPPPLLGLILSDPDGWSFQPPEAPHPSAAVARAVARGAYFSFDDYLPPVAGSRWRLWDVGEGRVLFRCISDDEDEAFLGDLAVCDPLARRCLLLPPIPDDLLASVQVQKQDFKYSDVFLVPSGYQEDDASFRVVARAELTEMVVTFIFSSAAGHWSAGASFRWDALSMPLEGPFLFYSSYAYGCFYWNVSRGDKWLKFDMSSMEFSVVGLPPGPDGSNVMIWEAGEGGLGTFTVINDNDECTSLCYSIFRQIGGDRFDQLETDTIVPLPVDNIYGIRGPYEGHIFISGYPSISFAMVCYALELKTMKIERVCQMRSNCVYPYLSFPPFMSQRRV